MSCGTGNYKHYGHTLVYKASINQSINQSTNWSINQSTNNATKNSIERLNFIFTPIEVMEDHFSFSHFSYMTLSCWENSSASLVGPPEPQPRQLLTFMSRYIDVLDYNMRQMAMTFHAVTSAIDTIFGDQLSMWQDVIKREWQQGEVPVRRTFPELIINHYRSFFIHCGSTS